MAPHRCHGDSLQRNEQVDVVEMSGGDNGGEGRVERESERDVF